MQTRGEKKKKRKKRKNISEPNQKHPDSVVKNYRFKFRVQLINVFIPHYMLLSQTGHLEQLDGLESPYTGFGKLNPKRIYDNQQHQETYTWTFFFLFFFLLDKYFGLKLLLDLLNYFYNFSNCQLFKVVNNNN